MTSAPPDTAVFSARHLTKTFRDHAALSEVTLAIEPGRVVGLLGRNGAGKTTLLHLAAGLVLPTAGTCHTFGEPSDRLGSAELTRLGLVMQEGRFIEWMTVTQIVDFTASFYPTWDRELQDRLVGTLELPMTRRVSDLSPGDRQKLSILLGVCHRPQLLLLDEPMSALDPIARTSMLDALLERLRDDGCTVVISSHLLTDVEKIVDWIITLHQGRLVENVAFDELQESFAEWIVTAPEDRLLPDFDEPFVVKRQVSGRVARVTVRITDPEAPRAFAQTHQVEVNPRRLNLDEMFPLLLGKGKGES